MKRDTSPIKVPAPSPVPRFGVRPTKREESDKERTRRKPKHPPKEHE